MARAVTGTVCPKSQPCPTCGASRGAPCTRPSGHRAAELHTERVLAAESIDRRNGLAPEQLDPAWAAAAPDKHHPGQRTIDEVIEDAGT